MIFWGWAVITFLAGVLLGLLFAGLLHAAARADMLKEGDDEGNIGGNFR